MTTLDDRITEVLEAAEAVVERAKLMPERDTPLGVALRSLVRTVAAYHVARDAQADADADARARLDRDEGGILASDGALWDFSTGGTP